LVAWQLNAAKLHRLWQEKHSDVPGLNLNPEPLRNLASLLNGLSGLATFELPQQIIWLAGISQGAYVAEKFLPAGTRTRIEQDLNQLRIAAANLIGARRAASGAGIGSPEAAPAALSVDQAQSAFEQAKQAAASTLMETYLDRFTPEEV
jgi:hypothetical protein